MSAYKPKDGDRVRVVLEGTVTRFLHDPLRFLLVGESIVRVPDDATVSIEKLPDPEPEWRAGDVVLDERGDVYTRSWGHWLRPGKTYPHPDVWPLRPLTLLVRGGKPVVS